MIIYIRHSNDEIKGDVTHAHDGHINSQGLKLAKNKAKELIAAYGQPYVIYLSPFQRCRETLAAMKPEISEKTKIIVDPDLSRYFSSREKQNPGVNPTTIKYEMNIYESWDTFKGRCKKHLKRIKRHDYISRDVVVWVITHALVLKQVAPVLKITLPEWMEFMHHFTVESKKERSKSEKKKKK